MNVTRVIKKFCNSVWCTNDTDKTIRPTLFFNVISPYINILLTYVKKFFSSSPIEFLGHVVEIRLRCLLELIVIEKPHSVKVLLQMSKQVKLVTGCQVGWVWWVRNWDSCSNLMSLTTAYATLDMCAAALSCSNSGPRVRIPLRFSFTAWRRFVRSSPK